MPRLGALENITIPWGTHLCTFYRSASELQRLVTSYLQVGLEDGECCVWITSPGITHGDAISALEKMVPQARNFLSSGQLEIIPCTQWYLHGGVLNGDRILEAWQEKKRRAVASYAGLRVTGDASWLQTRDHQPFLAYERQVTDSAAGEQMVALCTYPTAGWKPEDMLKVMQCHHSVLLPSTSGWKAVDVCHA